MSTRIHRAPDAASIFKSRVRVTGSSLCSMPPAAIPNIPAPNEFAMVEGGVTGKVVVGVVVVGPVTVAVGVVTVTGGVGVGVGTGTVLVGAGPDGVGTGTVVIGVGRFVRLMVRTGGLGLFVRWTARCLARAALARFDLCVCERGCLRGCAEASDAPVVASTQIPSNTTNNLRRPEALLSIRLSFGSWAVSASETPGFANPPHDGCAVSGARQLRARLVGWPRIGRRRGRAERRGDAWTGVRVAPVDVRPSAPGAGCAGPVDGGAAQ